MQILANGNTDQHRATNGRPFNHFKLHRLWVVACNSNHIGFRNVLALNFFFLSSIFRTAAEIQVKIKRDRVVGIDIVSRLRSMPHNFLFPHLVQVVQSNGVFLLNEHINITYCQFVTLLLTPLLQQLALLLLRCCCCCCFELCSFFQLIPLSILNANTFSPLIIWDSLFSSCSVYAC